MSFDLNQLTTTIAQHGTVVRVVVAQTAGSVPREVGAAMLVWKSGQTGTIGGGELEFRAAHDARKHLDQRTGPRLVRVPLGPDLGQCCGGAVTLLTETYGAKDLADLADLERTDIVSRPVTPGETTPLAVQRTLDRARAQGIVPSPQLLQGWMIEPITRPALPLWIYGAGHVGRALVDVLSPLPDLAITWVDTRPDRFPDATPPQVAILPASNPAAATVLAPHNAHHLVLTYSHSMDFDLCHAILSRPFASAGLIGSATKWARFRKRLATLGHAPGKIEQIQCPIGDPSIGKNPQAIAVGVASALLKSKAHNEKTNRGTPNDRGSAPYRRAADT